MHNLRQLTSVIQSASLSVADIECKGVNAGAFDILQFFSSVPSNGRGPLPLGCHGSVKQFE